MTEPRYQKRFRSYQNALSQFENAVKEYGDTEIDLLKEGIIQRFEYTHETAWKLLRDILLNEGHSDVLGSRSATRLAFNQGLIEDGEIWMEMINTRNLTVHTYNGELLQQEFSKITRDYLPQLIKLRERVEHLWNDLA